MNAKGGPSKARLTPWSTPHGRDESLRVRTYATGQAKEGASADSAEEMKDTTGVSPWRLNFFPLFCYAVRAFRNLSFLNEWLF